MKIIVVSECIYNEFCKPGCRVRKDKTLEELRTHLAKYHCVMLLKCPEEEIFGIFRFDTTRKMMERNDLFLEQCLNLAKVTAKRIKNYDEALRIKGEGISEVIIIGVDGSPVCGVERYLDSEGAVPNAGRPKKMEDWNTSFEGSGILIDLLKNELENSGIPFECFGVENLEKTKEKIAMFLNKTEKETETEALIRERNSPNRCSVDENY